MTTIELSAGQAALLREAESNDGVIHIGDWCEPGEQKAAKALVRMGMLSCGDPRGYGHHHVTVNGRQWLARAEQNSDR